jgi:uncharacterized membrane protein YcaP (DUF421 family)
MDVVVRACVVYAVVWLLCRVAGHRTLAQMTAFDFVLILIISEGIQQGLVGNDHSMAAAIIVVVTLVAIDLVLSILKQRWPIVGRIVDGVPVVLVEDGRPIRERLDRERIDVDDILDAARRHQGLTHLSEIGLAVLERDGENSIIPRRKASITSAVERAS